MCRQKNLKVAKGNGCRVQEKGEQIQRLLLLQNIIPNLHYENKTCTRCVEENVNDRRESGPVFHWYLTEIYTAS